MKNKFFYAWLAFGMLVLVGGIYVVEAHACDSGKTTEVLDKGEEVAVTATAPASPAPAASTGTAQ